MNRLFLAASALSLLTSAAFAQDSGYYQEPAYPAAADYYAQTGQGDVPYQDPAPAVPYNNAPITQVAPVAQNNIAPSSGSKIPNSAADFAVSADVGVVSDYRNRGVSRSDGPALQGRATLGFNGAYAGASASTVDLNTDPDANFETVLFGGYQSQFDGLDYDARLSYFGYPGGDNDDEDYWEFSLMGGYDFDVFYGSLTWAVSPNYINDSGVTLYYAGDVSVPLPAVAGGDLTAKGHLGFQFIGDDDRYVDDNAMDWLVGVNYKAPQYYNVDLGLSLVGTSLDDDDCAEECGSTVLLSAGKSFGW